jgi:hypothetical protein
MSSVKMRQLVEREIAYAIVDSLLEAGFSIAIDNGDNNGNEFEIAKTRNRRAIKGALAQTDDEYLFVYTSNDKQYGWVRLVYGNDGWDVLSDYTVNLEKFIGNGTKVAKITDKYAD